MRALVVVLICPEVELVMFFIVFSQSTASLKMLATRQYHLSTLESETYGILNLNNLRCDCIWSSFNLGHDDVPGSGVIQAEPSDQQKENQNLWNFGWENGFLSIILWENCFFNIIRWENGFLSIIRWENGFLNIISLVLPTGTLGEEWHSNT